MKSMKKKLLTAMALVLAMSMFSAIPAMASKDVGWKVSTSDSNGKNVKLQVEKGEKFYIGDLFREYENNSSMYTYYSGSYLDATYKSNKTSVVSVNASTGLCNPKKTGTATVTLKYGGVSYKAKINVVKKGKVSTSSEYKAINSKAKTVAQYYDTKITSKNFRAIAKAYYEYKAEAANVSTGSYGAVAIQNTEYYNLVDPYKVRVNTVYQKLYTYASHGTMPTISSVSAKKDSSSVTVKLESKLTPAQIARMSICYESYQTVSNKLFTTNVMVPVYVVDSKGSTYAAGLAKLTKGKTSFTVTMKTSVYSTAEKELSSGSYTLRIGSQDYDGTSMSSSKSFKVS